MKKTAFLLIAVLMLALGSAGVALAGDPDAGQGADRWATHENSRNTDGGDVVYRCGTDEKGAKFKIPGKDEIERFISENRIAAGGMIRVNFHVIYANNGTGNVPESQLDAQITVLNRNFAGQNYSGGTVPGAANTGYTFVKASVTRTKSNKWFGMTPNSSAEIEAKNALAVNWTSSLNLYTAKPAQSLLGWATFPQDLAANGRMDGVVIHYASLPGGTFAPYNLGGTATHEVGHWVGLYHTFQGGCGSNCSTTGDLVCDTPAMSTPTSGCPIGKDTCTSTGLDPINNYMDYSTDACYNNFTTGQDARADFLMSTYRPLIGSARIADAPADERKGDAGDLLDMGNRKAESGEDVFRCATDERGPKVSVPKEQVDKWIAENRIVAGGQIPVYFHVISGRNGEGNVSDLAIANQITVLNRNYAGQDYDGYPVGGAASTGYTFFLAGTTRDSNRKWFGMTPGSSAEAQAKNARAVTPGTALNIYSCKPGQNLLGWAVFPWTSQAGTNMDGVVIHYGSLPGGYLAPYNLGGTASHEVGHYLGLYHTFQGGCGTSDCAASGDLVCDTPAMSTPTSGCPTGKDTCAGGGTDPIHNYMDYSSDLCYNQFTGGQDTRMNNVVTAYRSWIGATRIANGAGISNTRIGNVLVSLGARPNPFNPRTKIEFGLPRAGEVTLRVFDIQGRLVTTLVNGEKAAGNHSVDFDGAKLASGIYVMRLQMPGGVEVNKRMTLMK